jgi:hypothetical protein
MIGWWVWAHNVDISDRYARGGAAAVDWSPVEDGGIDYCRDWEAI